MITIEGPDTLNDDELKYINSLERTKTSQTDSVKYCHVSNVI